MSSVQAVSVPRLYRLIADQIASKIAAGEFRPGARLPAERELAEQLNVARSTLREALIALEIGGYVEVRVGAGVFVLDANRRAPAAAGLERSDEAALQASARMDLLAAARDAGPFGLLDVRALVEPECAALAAQNAQPEQVAHIIEMHRRMDLEQSPEAGDFVHDRAFHQAIGAACGNPGLASVVTHVWDLYEASAMYRQLDKHFVDAVAWRAAIREHDRIVAAIVAKDPIRARHAMSLHLSGISSRLSGDISE
ncbi:MULTISPECIES: FadR/GntR family transcriptional regulator [unclassified Achromobacter]|uniref:FadR/GntR family transcriptional regulator n=1 Tax=unclassified Achromobacter TaxID=2626865 RepID=UPI000B51DF76|nr:MULTISPECIES: FadR/GntR family transcriptional regulator [unclassified Achromobacter]OWT80696.1 GntR family transcriptional regulator [Achromobacter sp. HZ34]OWT81212.1 GntR family transcriptional regulator [Achromobacter sp. HZ28]